MTPFTCARGRGSPGRHFLQGPRQLRFGRAPVPGRLVPSPLASCMAKLTDVEVRYLRSTASWRHIGHVGEVFLLPSRLHRPKFDQ